VLATRTQLTVYSAEALEIQMIGFNTAAREKFASEMGSSPLLVAQHICLADDYCHFLYKVRNDRPSLREMLTQYRAVQAAASLETWFPRRRHLQL